MIPRGIRNCNPLNIRRSRDQWKGLLKVQNDKSLLRTYRVKYQRYSVRTIIERWAPPSENQTRAYIGFVCEEMGVPPNFILNVGSLDDGDTYWACELVRAMALVENGNKCADLIRKEEIKKGYQLAFES